MRIRKALSLILALVMCLSLAVPAFAAEVDLNDPVATADTRAIIGNAQPMSARDIVGRYVKANDKETPTQKLSTRPNEKNMPLRYR